MSLVLTLLYILLAKMCTLTKNLISNRNILVVSCCIKSMSSVKQRSSLTTTASSPVAEKEDKKAAGHELVWRNIILYTFLHAVGLIGLVAIPFAKWQTLVWCEFFVEQSLIINLFTRVFSIIAHISVVDCVGVVVDFS